MKIVKIGIGVLVAVGLVVGGYTIIQKTKQKEAKEKTAVVYPIKVPVLDLKAKKVVLTLPYFAEVKNDKSVFINSKFSGKLNYVKSLGDKVKKGEVVAKIDASNLEAKLSDVQAQIISTKQTLNSLITTLNVLKTNHQRTKKLLDAKMASQEKYDNEKIQISQTNANINSTKAKLISLESNKKSILDDLKYSKIVSPINGVVSEKMLNIGDNVFPAKPIIKISSNDGNYLFFTLPNPVKEIIFNNKTYKVVDLHTTFAGVEAYKAKINNNKLSTGEKVDIKVVKFDGIGVFVPYDALLSIGGKNFVLISNGNKGIPKEVDVVATGSKGVVIKQKIKQILKANADILLKIKSGYPIKVIGE